MRNDLRPSLSAGFSILVFSALAACTFKQTDSASPLAIPLTGEPRVQATPVDPQLAEGQVVFPHTAPAVVGTDGDSSGPRCLRVFAMIDLGNTENLKGFLPTNLDCLDSADYQGRNLLTYALESNRVDALRFLLKVPGDTMQLKRLYQTDSRGLSLYGFAKHDIVTYQGILRMAYALGVRTQVGANGENLADLAWLALDGPRTLNLLLDEHVYANGKGHSENAYLVSAAREHFASFIGAYAERTNMPLDKYFYENAAQGTLLSIASASESVTSFSMAVHELYLNRGEYADTQGLRSTYLTDLNQLRMRLEAAGASADLFRSIDLFYVLLAQKYPGHWNKLLTAEQGQDSTVALLFDSILTHQSIALDRAVAQFVSPAQKPTVFDLRGKIEAQPKDTLQALFVKLAAINRYPSPASLRKLDLIETYISGSELGLYSPSCSDLGNPANLPQSVNQLVRLRSLGLDPSNCQGLQDRLAAQPAGLDLTLWLAKTSGHLSESATLVLISKNRLDALTSNMRAAGLESQFVQILNGTWQTLLNQQRDSLPQFLDQVDSALLLPQFARWLNQTSDAQETISGLCSNYVNDLYASGVSTGLARLNKLMVDMNINSSLCFRAVFERSSQAALSTVLKSDLATARTLLRDASLTQGFCARENATEASLNTDTFALNPAECWTGLLKHLQSTPPASQTEALQIYTATTAYAEGHPTLLASYQLSQAHDICAGRSTWNSYAVNAIAWPLIDSDASLGLSCVTGLVESGALLNSDSPSFAPIHPLRRAITPSEVRAFFASSGSPALSHDSLKTLNRALDSSEYAYSRAHGALFKLYAPALRNYLDQLSSDAFAKHVTDLVSTMESEIQSADSDTRSCYQTPAIEIISGLNQLGRKCPQLTATRWVLYPRLYMNNLGHSSSSTRTFFATWSKALESEIRARHETVELGRALDTQFAILMSQGLAIDLHSGVSEMSPFNRSDLLKTYCRVYPQEVELTTQVMYHIGEMIRQATGYDFQPAQCK